MRARKYLNNRDLLREIHKSKNSYSEFLTNEDKQYDIILTNIDQINIRTIAQAKKNRADRLARDAYETAYKNGERVKQSDFEVNWKKIAKTDLVFRIMTHDHVPLQPSRKKNPKTTADHHVQCNFPPFQHFRFTEEDNLICVGKSHWKGGLHNGEFCKDHGRITERLAHMFIKLCERYGSRSNWRGYTYNDEMQANALVQLSQVGLQFNEEKSQNPFAYYTAIITNSFTRVLNLEKKNQNIRDDILEQNGLNPSYTRQAQYDDAWQAAQTTTTTAKGD